MRKCIYLLAGILFFCLVATSCEDDIIDGSKADEKSRIGKMNIEDADLLYISKQESDRKLYGVSDISSLRSSSNNKSGVYEIEIYNPKGKLIKNKTPHYIKDAGEYIIAFFKNNPASLYNDEVYFISKKDGKAHIIPEKFFPVSGDYNERIFNKDLYNKRFVFKNATNSLEYLNINVDKHNRIYYTALECFNDGTCANVLYRASFQQNNEIKFEKISIDNEYASGYLIDNAGNSLYGSPGDIGLMRFTSADKKITNQIEADDKIQGESPLSQINFVWNSSDDIMAIKTIRGMRNPEDGSISYIDDIILLTKLDKETGEFEEIKELEFDFKGKLPTTTDIFYTQGKVLFSHSIYGTQALLDISNENAFQSISCPLAANIVIGDHLYNFDRNNIRLTLIDVETGNTTPIYDFAKSMPEGYRITNFLEITEEGVLFDAFRTSDKMNVVASIDVNKEFTILQESYGAVEVLVSMNNWFAFGKTNTTGLIYI